MTPDLSQPVATQNLRTTLVGAQPATSIPPNLSSQIIVHTKMQRRMGMEAKRRQRQFFSLFMSYFSLFLVQLYSIFCLSVVQLLSISCLFFCNLLSVLVYFWLSLSFRKLLGSLDFTFYLSFRKFLGH